MLSGKHCNLQLDKQKFYRALNEIFGKIGASINPQVLISLINSYCWPILLYGMEALCLNRAPRNTIDFVYNSAFVKIFNVKQKQSILECQYFTENLPATCVLDLRVLNFHLSLNDNVNSLPLINNLCKCEELDIICSQYSMPILK